MTNAPLDLIEDVLRRTLGPYGFDHAEVQVKEDHAGEEAIFINAILKPNSDLVGGAAATAADAALYDALLAQGDKRFAYIFIRHPDDEPSSEPPAMEQDPPQQ
ncbi:hypothetical protein [Blastochloris sulfoviridis]|uniref:Uncharacterized protein n=1 Tax=Blastochloris sulfoviridis TaxID=50712 RepID=A0A5M6I1U3_9HYPH|nr:hypothetical protein [Blastochloris sulfoviridis]KAA5601847.1 hypothetical protein F1193_07920 [Blastochloris sulfoviridis]